MRLLPLASLLLNAVATGQTLPNLIGPTRNSPLIVQASHAIGRLTHHHAEVI